MPSKQATTVVLTEIAQVVKEDLAPTFGLKNILSAGLVLLNKLSADDMVKAINEASGKEDEDAINLYEAQNILADARSYVRELANRCRVERAGGAGALDEEAAFKLILDRLGETKETYPAMEIRHLNRLIRQNIIRFLRSSEGVVMIADATSTPETGRAETGRTRRKAGR